MNRVSKRAALALAVWTCVGLLFAAQTMIQYTNIGSQVQVRRIIAYSLADWYIWVLFTPIVLAIARRVSLEPGRRVRGVFIHVVCAFGVAAARTGIRLALSAAFPLLRVAPRGAFAAIPLALIVYAAIVLLDRGYAYYRMYQEERLAAAGLQAQLASADLERLKIQIQPHFLFNTLNAISEQLHLNPAAADTMLLQLSDLLRHAVTSPGNEIPLREEKALLEKYVFIQHARFGDRVHIALDFDPSSLDCPVPSLILQPLVENAIQHGITPRASGGSIAVDTATSDGWLKLRVTDDGVGIRSTSSTNGGIGLANVRARLRHLYGEHHRFVLSGRPGGGTEVRIEIPLRREVRAS